MVLKNENVFLVTFDSTGEVSGGPSSLLCLLAVHVNQLDHIASKMCLGMGSGGRGTSR